MTSHRLPRCTSCRSGRKYPTSSVRNQPSGVKALRAASSLSRYFPYSAGFRARISPVSPIPTSFNPSSTTRISVPGAALPVTPSKKVSGSVTRVVAITPHSVVP
eukprot:GHVL01037828.1.p2 GENE.GHVL01037828.1~~GHVL01037828.1.p2  ORF type:complete len:104 (+),score=2.93 GHVL01037828.1:51-362(+)